MTNGNLIQTLAITKSGVDSRNGLVRSAGRRQRLSLRRGVRCMIVAMLRRQGLLGLLAGVLIGAGIGAAAMHLRHVRAAQRADRAADALSPAPTPYPSWHAAFMAQLRREKPEVVFLGDSITDEWRTVPWLWAQATPPPEARTSV